MLPEPLDVRLLLLKWELAKMAKAARELRELVYGSKVINPAQRAHCGIDPLGDVAPLSGHEPQYAPPVKHR